MFNCVHTKNVFVLGKDISIWFYFYAVKYVFEYENWNNIFGTKIILKVNGYIDVWRERMIKS